MTEPNTSPSHITSDAKSWWKKKWAQKLLIALIGIAGVYSLIYIDVISRARESFRKGDQYVEWHHKPELKKQHFEALFLDEKSEIDQLLEKEKLTKEEYDDKLDALEFDKEFHLEESSLKYAYQWYKDTYELFSPPESKWVRQARVKAPEILEMWKQELRENNIPFEDYMFE